MFTAAFCFLGIAAFIVAALACVVRANRADPFIEVDVGGLHAASVCISEGSGAAGGAGDREPTPAEKAKWQEMKATWMEWYAQCLEKVAEKQKSLYSWARTLALCAALSIIGVLLEAHFGESISLSGILAGLRRSHPVAAVSRPPHQNNPVANLQEQIRAEELPKSALWQVQF